MSEQAEPTTGRNKNRNEYSRKQLWAVGGLLTFLIGGLGFFAVRLAVFALETNDLPRLWRWMIVAFAVAIGGFVPLSFLWALGKRKLSTGRFLLRRSEVPQRREETMAKLGAGKPLRPQIGFWLLPLGLSIFLLAAAAAILGERSSWCDCDPRVRWLFYGFAGILAALGSIYPAMCVWRKVKTGHFLLSNEKIRARMARCGKPAPKWQRITVAAIFWFDAALFTYRPIHRAHASAISWIAALVWWVVAALWTIRAIRPSQRPCAWNDEEQAKGQPV